MHGQNQDSASLGNVDASKHVASALAHNVSQPSTQLCETATGKPHSLHPSASRPTAPVSEQTPTKISHLAESQLVSATKSPSAKTSADNISTSQKLPKALTESPALPLEQNQLLLHLKSLPDSQASPELSRTQPVTEPHKTKHLSQSEPHSKLTSVLYPGKQASNQTPSLSQARGQASLPPSKIISKSPSQVVERYVNKLKQQTKLRQQTKVKQRTQTSNPVQRVSRKNNAQSSIRPRISVPIAPAIVYQLPTATIITHHAPVAAMANQPTSQPSPSTTPSASGSNSAPVQSVNPPQLTPSTRTTTTITPTATATVVPQSQPVENLKSLALNLVTLITNYLGAAYAGGNAAGSTLTSLKDRLQVDVNPCGGNRAELAWAVRDAIRNEFLKVVYPTPPLPSLLQLVCKTELLLINTDNQTRPIFFPGARVTAPTNDGSRRVATSLQLRSKQVLGSPIMEAMLHLDGPDGGTFQWVQVSSLALLSGSTPPDGASATLSSGGAASTHRNGGRGRSRRTRSSRNSARGARSRKTSRGQQSSSDGAIVPLTAVGPVSASNGTLPPLQPLTQNISVGGSVGLSRTNSQVSRGGSTTGRNSVGGRNVTGSRAAGTGRAAATTPRGPPVEPSAVVPTSLISTSPPPRSRIVDPGLRPVSFTSGSLRRALDVTHTDVARSAGKLKLVLGIERLVARRHVEDIGVQYFVKWSGCSMREGSWELRDSLMEDVPGLVREFDIRHPEENVVMRLGDICRKANIVNGESADRDVLLRKVSEVEKSTNIVKKDDKIVVKAEKVAVKEESEEMDRVDDEAKGKVKQDEKEYIDDVSGVKIPSWVDTPILELNISGMVLQLRRPNDYSLHNDLEAAARDAKRRQAEFKKKDIERAARVYSLSRTEARFAIDHGLRARKEFNQRAIQFPRGLGRVSASDHGVPFAANDALMAPANWDAYFLRLGMKCSDFSRDLPPYMPTVDTATMAKIVKAKDDAAFALALEHRERARSLVREAFRYDGLVTPPAKLFRDGIRLPPGVNPPQRKRARIGMGAADSRMNGDPKGDEAHGRPDRQGLLHERFGKLDKVLKGSKKGDSDKRGDGMWFDSVWACWRRAPSND